LERINWIAVETKASASPCCDSADASRCLSYIRVFGLSNIATAPYADRLPLSEQWRHFCFRESVAAA